MGVNGENDDDDINSASGTDASDDFGASDLARIGEMSKRIPSAQRELRRRHEEVNRQMKAFKEMEKKDLQIPTFRKQFLEAAKKFDTLTPKMRNFREANKERLNAQAVNVVNREFNEGRINSTIANSMNSSATQIAGLGMTNTPFEELATRRKDILGQVGSLRSDSVSAAGKLIGRNGIDSEVQSKLQDNASKVKELVDQLGPIGSAMKQQKALGQDPESRHKSLLMMGDKAQGIVGFSKLQEEIKAGKGQFGNMSKDDLQKKEVEAAQKLVTALDELRGAAGKTKEELSKLNKNAEDAAGELKNVQEAKAAGAGSNGGNKLGQAYASAISNLALTAANTIQNIGIAQPMQQMSNVAGYANIENQKYSMRHSAIGGDMTARMNLGGWDAAQGFGSRMANNAGWVLGARGLAGGATAVAGGFQTAEAIGQTSNVVGWGLGNAEHVKNVTEAAGTTVEGLSIVASTGMDALRHVSTSSAEISGVNASMAATKEVNFVMGRQRQEYRDYMMGMLETGRGMGAKRASSFLDEVGGEQFMGQARGVGLGLDETASLSQQGFQNMGSMFKSDQVLHAKRLENEGRGSASENMARMGMLAAGGQNPSQSLEKLLEMAVGKGLDSSKTQTMIAEHTGQLVTASAMRGGPDVSYEASKSLVGLIDKNNPNQELATRRAMESQNTARDIISDRGANFSSMMSVSNLVTKLKLDPVSVTNAQNMSFEELETIRGIKDKSEQSRLFRIRGVNVSDNEAFGKDSGKFINDMQEGQASKLLRMRGVGMAVGTPEDEEKTLKFLKNDTGQLAARLAHGDTKGMPDYVERFTTRQFAASNALDPTKSGEDSLRTYFQLRHMPLGDKLATPLEAEKGGAYGNLTDEKARAGRQQTDLGQAGRNSMGATTGAQGAAAIAATGDAAEKAGGKSQMEWAETAAKSAADFGESATKLNGASDKLVDAANKLITVAGIIGLAKIDAKDKFTAPPPPVIDITKVGRKQPGEM